MACLIARRVAVLCERFDFTFPFNAVVLFPMPLVYYRNMNTNKKVPFIIGTIVILVAVGVVLIQRPSQTNIPTPITPESQTTTTYTMADVITHKTPTNCWTTINGSVYNVTPWISQHPGGAEAIISLCGIDGTAAFSGQHGGQARPASELASFKIGTLK